MKATGSIKKMKHIGRDNPCDWMCPDSHRESRMRLGNPSPELRLDGTLYLSAIYVSAHRLGGRDL